MPSLVDTLFPAPPGMEDLRRKHNNPAGAKALLDYHASSPEYKGRQRRETIPTSWAAVYQLELRGMTQEQIAEATGYATGSIYKIVNDDRYLKYREEHLTALDHEFVSMKPLAFAALKGGLGSADENTALRASEQWFKAAGFGGFAKNPEPPVRASAEDIVAQLLNINGDVTVNIQNNTAAAPADDE